VLRSALRNEPELVVLVVLLLIGLAVVVAFTGRDGPPHFVIWLLLGWLIALVTAMGAYIRATAKRNDRKERTG
jgi:hypothetical protein